MDQLSGKVLTVEVWKAEREAMEFRIRETEKDIATLEAKTSADRDKRELEKQDQDSRAKALRTQFVFAILTAVIAPILVGIVLAATLKG
jgi:F0F1-type ATP synthase assembly protein I